MKLSVIIVNYNVEFFLEQCLNSVLAASNGIDVETIVVDNNSVDNSLNMLNEKFPQIKLIANKDNRGFSKANNQGIVISKGEYVLLLNPDTIVEEDTFKKVLDFMDAHPDAGGLGVRMLDGKGRFLPESKRGLPTPAAAFFKMFGLSKLFPKSKKFAAYHAGHLPQDETHEVEVLSGAFMLMRKTALDKVGLLDEDFFMYGEDIDLSYRLIKGGFKNYYFAGTRIIHYKGESTKKNTVNYVYVFYNAMVIFAKKHYSKENAKLFSFLINSAIVLRALVSIVASTIKSLVVPFIDFIIVYAGMFIAANYWGEIILGEQQHYPIQFLYIVIPIIILFWQLSVYYSGGYDKPIKAQKILLGLLIGVMLILVVYALLPEIYRFSRALILFGALWSAISMISWRFIVYLLGVKSMKFGSKIAKRISVVGSDEETERVLSLINNTSIDASFLSKILLDIKLKTNVDTRVLGSVEQLKEIVKIHKISELIFCAKDFKAREIIDLMAELKSPDMDFKIAPPEQMFIIGSSSIDTSSDVYFVEVNAINKQSNKRFKRLFDFVISCMLLLTYPLHFWLSKQPLGLIKNLVLVIIGKYTLVGFDEDIKDVNLPQIKRSLLHPSDLISDDASNEDKVRINLVYARNYRIGNDFNILFKAFRLLGRINIINE
ncbi:MAG: glycosyl transferase family 2 [Bacteroidetes bacterium]|nr:MAG: glycosyl transferase family 2 [Bacteroidota bacterium]